MLVGAPKDPRPSPSMTLTSLAVGGREVEVAVVVEVADRKDSGLPPVGEVTAGWNVPSGLPSSTLTSLLE